MRNAVFVVLGVIALLAIGFFALNTYIYNEKQGDGCGVDTATYFQTQMIALGVADVGQPIEGFDSNMLMLAYPGLLPSDFEGVHALEGEYRLQNGEAIFVRTQSQPISSAERTISSQGYATLLSNLSVRFSHPTYDEADVDELIGKIDTNERVKVKMNESATAFGVTVTPLALLEDSRCPVDVQCIQAGTVRIRAIVESGLGVATQEFRLLQPITTEAEDVTLLSVSPMSEAGKAIEDSEYIFTFEIKKRSNI